MNKQLADFCSKLPYEQKINKGIRKYILREASIKLGLSNEISLKEKKAAQYGSGIMHSMKRIAKKQNIRLENYINNIKVML